MSDAKLDHTQTFVNLNPITLPALISPKDVAGSSGRSPEKEVVLRTDMQLS